MKEIVDRLAGALFASDGHGIFEVDETTPLQSLAYRIRAVDALKALREPCPHAVAAAAGKLELPPYTVAGVWITMVDEVLK